MRLSITSLSCIWLHEFLFPKIRYVFMQRYSCNRGDYWWWGIRWYRGGNEEKVLRWTTSDGQQNFSTLPNAKNFSFIRSEQHEVINPVLQCKKNEMLVCEYANFGQCICGVIQGNVSQMNVVNDKCIDLQY